MALPNTNISVAMVKSELGAATNDVGTLCSHPNINRWSRYKPYSYPQVTGIYGTSGTDDTIPKDTLNWEINPALITAGNLPDSQALADNWGKWGQWEPPSGGTESPYRLEDFRNYNHHAKPAIGSVVFYNDNGGTRPVVSGGRAKTFQFRAKLILNADADIQLSEYKATVVGSIMNMHLTLVIGTQMPSLSYPEARLVQSTKTIGQAIADGDTEIIAEMDTSNLDTENVLITPKNIIFAYLAPKTTSTTVFPEGLSLKIQDGIRDAYFNDTYATYGDGSSDGGTIPIIQVSGYIYVAQDHPTIPNGDYWVTQSGNTYYFHMTNVVIDITTGSATAQGTLRLFIDSSKEYYAVPNSAFSASTGTKHFGELIVAVAASEIPAGFSLLELQAVLTDGTNNVSNNITRMGWSWGL